MFSISHFNAMFDLKKVNCQWNVYFEVLGLFKVIYTISWPSLLACWRTSSETVFGVCPAPLKLVKSPSMTTQSFQFTFSSPWTKFTML